MKLKALVIKLGRYPRVQYHSIGNFIYRYRFKSLSVPGRLKHSLEEHQAIMESLKKHNSEEADRLSQIHMENTVINILKNVVKENNRE